MKHFQFRISERGKKRQNKIQVLGGGGGGCMWSRSSGGVTGSADCVERQSSSRTVQIHWWHSVTSGGTHRDDGGFYIMPDIGADLRADQTAALRVPFTCYDSSVSHCWMKLSYPLHLPEERPVKVSPHTSCYCCFNLSGSSGHSRFLITHTQWRRSLQSDERKRHTEDLISQCLHYAMPLFWQSIVLKPQ